MHDLDGAGMGTLHQQRGRPLPEVHTGSGDLHRPSPCYRVPEEYPGPAPLRDAVGNSSGLGRQRYFPQIGIPCMMIGRDCSATATAYACTSVVVVVAHES